MEAICGKICKCCDAASEKAPSTDDSLNCCDKCLACFYQNFCKLLGCLCCPFKFLWDKPFGSFLLTTVCMMIWVLVGAVQAFLDTKVEECGMPLVGVLGANAAAACLNLFYGKHASDEIGRTQAERASAAEQMENAQNLLRKSIVTVLWLVVNLAILGTNMYFFAKRDACFRQQHAMRTETTFQFYWILVVIISSLWYFHLQCCAGAGNGKTEEAKESLLSA